MTNTATDDVSKGDPEGLPAVATTRSGVSFSPRSDRWIYRDSLLSINLNFSGWPTTAAFVNSAKHACLWYAREMSASHLKNMHAQLERFLSFLCQDRGDPLSEIVGSDIVNYRTALNPRTEWYLGSLSGFLQKWHELGYPGVSDDAAALLRELRIRGNRKGEAVLTHDPVRGPFTDIEATSLRAALDRAYYNGEVSEEGYMLAYLVMALGQRPVQYAALKVRDIRIVRDDRGTSAYILRVPRAKQRNRLSRSEFKTRALVPAIGKPLMDYAHRVKGRFYGVLPDPADAPLFPEKQRRSEEEPEEFRHHRTSAALRGLLKTTLSRLHAMSERTGARINVSAVRFRRTVATRAAIEGHGPLVIAELLDHSDTQNVGVYIDARPEILDRIDRALATRLAPLAQAFAGLLVDDESQAVRGSDASSRIYSPGQNGTIKPLGNCGKHGFCGLFAPIACYTCAYYQPWLDGPHEEILQHLLAERERLSKDADMRIASINDRTILAVAQVIALCDARRREQPHG